jgi:hypothetical protein
MGQEQTPLVTERGDKTEWLLEDQVLRYAALVFASYHAMCHLTGHHGWLGTSDGRLWRILEGKVSEELIHDSSLLGRRVRIRGRIMRKAGSIEVSDYQLL